VRVHAVICLSLALCAACSSDRREVSRPHAAKGAPRGVIDVPRKDGSVQPRFMVAGWVVDGHGVRTVRLYLDDVLVAQVAPSVPRPDVLTIVPEMSGSNPTPGWMIEVDAGSLRGNRIVRAESIDREGGRAEFATTTITIQDYGIRSQ